MPKKRAPRPKPGVTIPSSLSGYGGDGVEGPTTRGRFSREVGAMGYCAGPVIASGMPEGTSSFLRIWRVTESHLIFLQITFQIYESGVWNRMKLVSPPRCRTSIRPHSFPCFTSTSSLIRPLSPSSSSISSQSLTNNPNFTLHPNFYTPSECRQLLSAALWKLDRVDSSRRRSRSPQSSPLASESDDSLQDLFQGPYGFEEVPLPFSYWLYHVLIDARATSIR
jgi:hypothetical protein